MTIHDTRTVQIYCENCGEYLGTRRVEAGEPEPCEVCHACDRVTE